MEQIRGSRRWAWAGAAVAPALLVGLLVGGGIGSTVAQDATPAGGVEGAVAGRPAHIHAGSCERLGDVVVPLTDVAHAEGETVGRGSVTEVKWSETTVEMPLAEIVEGGHAVNVHESAGNIGEYVACGDNGGTMRPRGRPRPAKRPPVRRGPPRWR